MAGADGDAEIVRQMGHLNGVFAGHDDGALQDVAKLADIAGPGVFLESFHYFVAHVGDAAQVFAVERFDERFRENGQIGHALAQGREGNLEDVEAIEEIFAKIAFFESFVKVAIGGGDDADVDGDFIFSTQAAYARIFQNTQEFGLRAGGHFGEFVEEQRAVLGELETTGAAFERAREGAFLVAEELTLHERFRHGGTVDGDKRATATRTQLMYGARDQFLTGTAFTHNEDGRFAGRYLANDRKHRLHLGRSANHIGQHALILQLTLQAFGFFGELALRGGALDQKTQSGGLDGLFEKPIGAEIVGGFDGGFDVAESGENDGRGHIAIRGQALHELEAVHARHHEIGDYDMRREKGELVERFLAIGGRFGAIAPTVQHGGQTLALRFFIVNDQNVNGLTSHGLCSLADGGL